MLILIFTHLSNKLKFLDLRLTVVWFSSHMHTSQKDSNVSEFIKSRSRHENNPSHQNLVLPCKMINIIVRTSDHHNWPLCSRQSIEKWRCLLPLWHMAKKHLECVNHGALLAVTFGHGNLWQPFRILRKRSRCTIRCTGVKRKGLHFHVIVGFCGKFHALYWSQQALAVSVCTCMCVCLCTRACQAHVQRPRINKHFPYVCLVIACLLFGDVSGAHANVENCV